MMKYIPPVGSLKKTGSEADGKFPDTRHPESRGMPVLRISLATEGRRHTVKYAAMTGDEDNTALRLCSGP